MRSSQYRVIWLVVLALLGAGIFQALRLVWQADDSERKLHALVCVANVMTEYLKAHDRAWPRSWSDLREVNVVEQGSMYHWPDDADEVERRVEIDFGVTAEDLASDDFDVSRVIRPRGEYMYNHATRLYVLQQFIEVN